jgi:uncharacterized protein YjbJ (UPF0337 family)
MGGADDKASNIGEKVTGKAKEAMGKVTGDEKQETEGKTDQKKADAKQTGEKAKDVFRD